MGGLGLTFFSCLAAIWFPVFYSMKFRRKAVPSCQTFLIRRGFKIYPSFYFALAFTLGWRLVFLDDSLSRLRLAGEVLFLQNYLGLYWQHHWSLAVEEHFYLLLALGVGITQRVHRGPITLNGFRFLPVVWAGVACICLLLRLHVSLTQPFDVHSHLIPTHMRIDSLLAGSLLAWLMHHCHSRFRPPRQTRLLLLLAGAGLFVPPFLWDFSHVWWVLPFGALLHAAGAVMIILAGYSRQGSATGMEKCMAWVGARSYNIYLWHLPWLFWLNPVICNHLGISKNWVLCATCYIGGSVLVGSLMTAVLEKPFLRMRDKFYSSMPPPLPAAA